MISAYAITNACEFALQPSMPCYHQVTLRNSLLFVLKTRFHFRCWA